MQTKFGIPIGKFFKHKDYDTDIMVSSIVYLEGSDEYSICTIKQNGGLQIPSYETIKNIHDFKARIF